jgi:hypothetical protein
MGINREATPKTLGSIQSLVGYIRELKELRCSTSPISAHATEPSSQLNALTPPALMKRKRRRLVLQRFRCVKRKPGPRRIFIHELRRRPML